eukprot:7141368-Karenia_brevis.AAC.1
MTSGVHKIVGIQTQTWPFDFIERGRLQAEVEAKKQNPTLDKDQRQVQFLLYLMGFAPAAR